MKSLISKYSLEGNTNGKPNGHFYMTHQQTSEAMDEILDTHLQYKGDERKRQVKDKMELLWPKYDNLNEGFLDVQRAAVLLRHAIGDVEFSIGLQ